jgi:phage terminase large subunit-like protein
VNAIREEVGQGYVSISPRIQAMETALLQEKIRHGNDQPVLALGASSAIVVQDHQLNRKLDKTKASNKIDALMASLFAVYPLIAQTEEEPVDMSWALTLEPDNFQGGFSPWR